LKRGTDAPLKTPPRYNPEQRASKRDETSLTYSFPLPLTKGKGDKGGRGSINSPDLINQVTWRYSLTDVPTDDGRYKTC